MRRGGSGGDVGGGDAGSGDAGSGGGAQHWQVTVRRERVCDLLWRRPLRRHPREDALHAPIVRSVPVVAREEQDGGEGRNLVLAARVLVRRAVDRAHRQGRQTLLGDARQLLVRRSKVLAVAAPGGVKLNEHERLVRAVVRRDAGRRERSHRGVGLV
eukprot:scaffold57267_cov71-Phaeocystis_antarctica.AAC.3